MASTRVEEGVAPGLASLLEDVAEHPGQEWRAIYSYKYLCWLVGRCPTLRSWTISTSEFKSALLLWHPRASPRSWRAALWTRAREASEAEGLATTLLLRGVAHVLAQGGSELSILASRSDGAESDLLRSRGFKPTKTARPLFIFDGPQPQAQIEDLRGLSFVAADLGYRF